MSANKTNIKESNEEEKVAINLKQNNSQILRCSKDYIRNLHKQNANMENNKSIESENNSKILFKQNDVESIKQKLKENLDSNLNSYILSTKSKEQKILELLELINQYEAQIASLNNQITLLTNNNKQTKEILKNMESNYSQVETDLISEKETNKNNINIINGLNQDKTICEKKIKELVNIINQYTGQIEALTENLNNLKDEFFLYKNANEQDKNKLNELNLINNALNEEKEELNIICDKLNEENIKLKQDNKNLYEKFNDLEKDYKKLKEKNAKTENSFEKEKNKFNDLINYINQDLESLNKYFENKINQMLINDNIKSNNENKLSLNCFKNIENIDEIKNINFENFIKALINGIKSFKEKMKIQNENSNDIYVKEIKKLKEKITENENKEIQNEKMKELLKIKDENIFKLKEDVKKLLQDNIKLIKELQKFNGI